MRRCWELRFLCLTMMCALVPGLRANAVQLAPATNIRSFSEVSFDKSNFKQLSLVEARRQCGDKLQARVLMIDAVAKLRDEQREELMLAGQIDIHRFFDLYAAAKRTMKFRGISQNQWQAQYARIREEIRPLIESLDGGLHGNGSLFAKTLNAALDESQRQRVDELFRRRAKSTYSDYIQVTLAIIDRTLPLTQKQRSRMTELTLAQTDPPQNYGSGTDPVFRVLSKMAEIETELRDEFSDQEWQIMISILRSERANPE